MPGQIFIRSDGRFPYDCYWVTVTETPNYVLMKPCDPTGYAPFGARAYRVSVDKVLRDFQPISTTLK